MMPAAKGMSHMIPNHVLRVGQTIRLDPVQETVLKEPSSNNDDLDISLDNLNQLMLDLDPTFEPIPVNNSPSCISPSTDDSCSDEDVSQYTLVPRGCHPCSSPSVASCVSPSIPIPTQSRISYSPQGALVFSSSPTSSLPPLPGGSVLRRNPTPRSDTGCLRLSQPNRNSVTSLLSMSTCSDTSYILGSNLSLTSEDADFPESILSHTPGSFSDGSRMRTTDNMHSPEKPPLIRRGHLQEQYGTQSSPASLSGSFTDIPVLLVNGTPQSLQSLGPGIDLTQNLTVSNLKPHSIQARFNGSQPSMKFVMDTSKFWFRPHVTRTEAEALLRDKEPGTFVVRDSTSHRGSFGLAMQIDQTSANLNVGAYQGENSPDLIRHFLIESSAKGVRIKGSSQEPYFGSLSALVYQHTISAYALPCKLILHSQDLSAADTTYDKIEADDKRKTASNFIYLNTVPTEMLTGPCAVQKAVSSTFRKAPGSFTPTIVNMKVSLKGVTLTDINRKLFFRRHYPAHLLSYSGEDPDNRLWVRGSSFGARMFGFVAKGVEAGMENVCHVFAEYDPLQPCNKPIEIIQAAIAKL
ncbi:tensin-4-like [Notolabrus celidotus]|uniref:tensin-4-like n=1 Tax=Notolabrus celidotus TaxID=1203425 RepID=UPI00148F83A0|nr:tensin-4-like [Notolabrus celidotus]XP_034544260.1 tensin-4-like [Notolabrus celidotus]